MRLGMLAVCKPPQPEVLLRVGWGWGVPKLTRAPRPGGWGEDGLSGLL